MLPSKGKGFNRTIAYLTKTRGINKEIVYAMINAGKVCGTRTEAKKDGHTYANCTFVGYDKTGEARCCALRASCVDSSFR